MYIQDGHGEVVDRVNVNSPDVEITEGKMKFRTNFILSDNEEYHMVFEQGKAKATIYVCMELQ